jgi:hypothetical protein
LFAKAIAYFTAGTSSSSFNIGGSGPTGVMLRGLIYERISVSPYDADNRKENTYISMTLGVMALNVREFRSVIESWDIPVQMSQPFVDIRIA